jgi:hypothetical protein
MALLWIDGFDNYGVTAGAAPSPTGVLARKYGTVAQESAMRIYAGRLGGYCISMYNGAFALASPVLTTDATLVVGLALKYTNLGSSTGPFVRFDDGANWGMSVWLSTGGELAVRNRSSAQLQITSGLELAADSWYYIEFKVVCGATGSYSVYVDGVEVLSATGVDTRATEGHDYCGTFRLYAPNYSGATHYFDDLYCLDGTGSLNAPLGNCRVSTIRPDVAGDSAQFTPDTGDNYARVAETVCDDDTSYVEDSTSTHKDLYGYAALAGIVANIKGVMVCTDCRETDATSFSIKTVCKSGATESDDTGLSVGSTNYVTRRRVLEDDPNTTDPWDKDDLDAAQFGVKVV